jgi:two-component system LytT family sensor kinase
LAYPLDDGTLARRPKGRMATSGRIRGLAILRERWREWLGVAALCFGLALAYSLAWKVRHMLRGEPVDWSAIPVQDLLHFGAWLLLYPAVVLLTVRFPLGVRRRRNLFLHVILALFFSPLLMTVTVGLRMLARAQPMTWSAFLRDAVVPEYAWGVTVYVILLSMAHAAELRRRDQARVLSTAQLEAALARARLAALRMQLEPHFLFNALNSVSSLVHRDPDGAERMLARLGDFLRLTLDDSMPQKVELRQELEFLERYLDIERVRFSDRLSVVLDVPAELLDARVPYLILQPLVENAIRHGLAERAGPGRIVVRASLRATQLRVEVEDDGPGLRSWHLPAKLGVGLSNIRARLDQLYGRAASLNVEGGSAGGVRVTVALPWETGAASLDSPAAAV